MDESPKEDYGENDVPHSQKATSLSRIFSISLISFFILQLVAGVLVVVFYIGGAMMDMKLEGVAQLLKSHRQTLDTYLDDRIALLQDYAKLPVVVDGVLHPETARLNTRDTFTAISVLHEEGVFCLQDFEGTPVYCESRMSLDSRPFGELFHDLMHGKAEFGVSVLSTDTGVFWRLSVPVASQGKPAGVLSVFFPLHLERILVRYPGEERAELEILYKGEVVANVGSRSNGALRFALKSRYPGLDLVQYVDKSEVNRKIKILMAGVILALLLGSMMLLLVLHRLGRRFLIIPHERLQLTREWLEKTVSERTADLNTRSEQLSNEIQVRREAEVKANENSQLVSDMLVGIGAAFYAIDPEDTMVVHCNPLVFELFGLPPDTPLNVCAEFFNACNVDTPELICPVSVNKEYCEGVITRCDGELFPVARHLVPVNIRGKKHVGVILIDITERKALERRLYVAQKLESIGELASGIAHEINTPIQYVGDSVRFTSEAFEDLLAISRGFLELHEACRKDGAYVKKVSEIDRLLEDNDFGYIVDEIPKACDRAMDGVGRVAQIVRAMKSFAHPGKGYKEAVDINTALENIVTVARNEWKYVAEVEKHFGDLPTVKCLPGDINQAFLNILVNAAHAIQDAVGDSGEKGTITITTLVDDNFVEVRFKDTGIGIVENNTTKIFDPFFTTKEVGRGSGQGLAITHETIVERHGGSIDVHSTVGKGTTIVIRLPIEASEGV